MNEVIMSIAVLGIAGLFFSILLAFLSKKLSVEEDPRLEKILNILPNLNCGACGFSSCRVFAETVASRNKIFSTCFPGGDSVNSLIPKVLGIEPGAINQKIVAVCRCGAEQEEKKVSCFYKGLKTCKAADLIGGSIDCSYGCLGFGDCIRICPIQAITIKKKIYIDIKKCMGCGKCQEICPRHLFELIPLREEVIYYVACNNKERGVNVKKVCSRGCIGCGICVKTAASLFYLKDNLAFIDYKKNGENKLLEEAKNKCFTKCIVSSK